MHTGNYSGPGIHTAATQERVPNQFLRVSQCWKHQGSDDVANTKAAVRQLP